MHAVRCHHAGRRLALAVGLVCAMRAIDVSGQTPSGDKSRQLYVAQCAMCHGQDGTPKPIAKAAPAFADPAWMPSRETIVGVLVNGKGQLMRPFKGRLTPEQMEGLADYLLKMKETPAALSQSK